MESVNAVSGMEHSIQRADVYVHGIDLYREGDIVGECPIYIAFRGEIGVDNGGVQRDMFSAFWDRAYSELFEGSTLLTPMVHPQTDLTVLPIIGRILSHGYLVIGMLPTRIALPTLIHMLLGPSASVSRDILLNCFLDYISCSERSTMKLALAHTKNKGISHWSAR